MSFDQTTPTIQHISYIQQHLISDVANHDFVISTVKSKIDSIMDTLSKRRNYLKKLLIYKAERKLVEIVNDYVALLCSLYKSDSQPPDMETDTTPGWLIADAVVAEKNDKDRIAFTDIFIFVYGFSPETYFV
jgi:hypothetical protein